MSALAFTAGEQSSVADLQAWFAREATRIREALDGQTALSEHRIGSLRILRACVQAYEVLKEQLAAVGLLAVPAVVEDPSVGREPLLRNHLVASVEVGGRQYVLDVVSGRVTPAAEAGLLSQAQQDALLSNGMAALKAVPGDQYAARLGFLARRLGVVLSPVRHGPAQPVAGLVVR